MGDKDGARLGSWVGRKVVGWLVGPGVTTSGLGSTLVLGNWVSEGPIDGGVVGFSEGAMVGTLVG